MEPDPNCKLCFGRGWVLYPRMGGSQSAEACHYCARARDQVRSTETEGLGPKGDEPGPAGTRPEASAHQPAKDQT